MKQVCWELILGGQNERTPRRILLGFAAHHQLGTGSGQSLSQPSQNTAVVMLQPLRFPDNAEIQFGLLRELGAVRPWLMALGAWRAP